SRVNRARLQRGRHGREHRSPALHITSSIVRAVSPDGCSRSVQWLHAHMPRICLRPLVNAANLPDIRIASGDAKTIGRSISADVVIDEPSLSRLHAKLTVDENGRLTVEDLGSTNGIFVNGEQRMSGAVAAGDHVRFGFLEYLVEAERSTQVV